MSFLVGSLLGPLFGSLFHIGGHPATLDGASAQLAASEEQDSISTMMTRSQLSARSTKIANLVAVADEHVRESSMFDEFTIAAQGAEQHVIQKQMQLIDNSTS